MSPDYSVTYVPDRSHVGLNRNWQLHLAWLASNVQGTRWIKTTDAAWDFGGWEAT